MSHDDRRKRELQQRTARMRQLQEVKKKEEMLLNQANKALDEGKRLVDGKKFKEAKPFYEEAIDIFNKLGWTQQVDVLKDELKNIDKYAEELKEKLKQDFINRKKQEKAFEQRAAGIIAKKKKKEEERLARMQMLSPQLQRNLKTAKMALEKAEKELKLKKYQRVINRYEYILDLYRTIPIDKLNLSQDISEIEQEISELKLKL